MENELAREHISGLDFSGVALQDVLFKDLQHKVLAGVAGKRTEGCHKGQPGLRAYFSAGQTCTDQLWHVIFWVLACWVTVSLGRAEVPVKSKEELLQMP